MTDWITLINSKQTELSTAIKNAEEMALKNRNKHYEVMLRYDGEIFLLDEIAVCSEPINIEVCEGRMLPISEHCYATWDPLRYFCNILLHDTDNRYWPLLSETSCFFCTGNQTVSLAGWLRTELSDLRDQEIDFSYIIDFLQENCKAAFLIIEASAISAKLNEYDALGVIENVIEDLQSQMSVRIPRIARGAQMSFAQFRDLAHSVNDYQAFSDFSDANSFWAAWQSGYLCSEDPYKKIERVLETIWRLKPNPIKGIKSITGDTNLSISKKYGFSLRAVENWSSGSNPCPEATWIMLAYISLGDIGAI